MKQILKNLISLITLKIECYSWSVWSLCGIIEYVLKMAAWATFGFKNLFMLNAILWVNLPTYMFLFYIDITNCAPP